MQNPIEIPVQTEPFRLQSPAPLEVRLNVLDLSSTILTVSGVLAARECQALIEGAEGLGFSDAPITTARGFVHRPEFRNNTRVILDDHGLAAALWARVRAVLPQRIGPWRAVGLNERLRFYRYHPGQHFRWHHDGAFVRSATERSLLSFMIYLNDGFSGGATEFADLPGVVPRQGMALVFQHPVMHQGATVERGIKYVLRSDVMYAEDPALPPERPRRPRLG